MSPGCKADPYFEGSENHRDSDERRRGCVCTRRSSCECDPKNMTQIQNTQSSVASRMAPGVHASGCPVSAIKKRMWQLAKRPGICRRRRFNPCKCVWRNSVAAAAPIPIVCVRLRAGEGGGLLMCVRGAEEPEGAVESGGEKIGAKMASWLADLCVDRGHRSD